MGIELIRDPRLPALAEIMQEKFRVKHFVILAKAGMRFDVPDCLDFSRVERLNVQPVGSGFVTQSARIEQPLSLQHAIHVQSHSDLCVSVAISDVADQALRMRQFFPAETEVHTMKDLRNALNQAEICEQLQDHRLRSEIARRSSSQCSQQTATPLKGGWASYRFGNGNGR